MAANAIKQVRQTTQGIAEGVTQGVTQGVIKPAQSFIKALPDPVGVKSLASGTAVERTPGNGARQRSSASGKCGGFIIEALWAEGLRAADIRIRTDRSSDPYCHIAVSGAGLNDQTKTAVVYNTLNPDWTPTFKAPFEWEVIPFACVQIPRLHLGTEQGDWEGVWHNTSGVGARPPI